jgi:hypothetical protein
MMTRPVPGLRGGVAAVAALVGQTDDDRDAVSHARSAGDVATPLRAMMTGGVTFEVDQTYTLLPLVGAMMIS